MLRFDEVAKNLKISRESIYNYIQRGLLPRQITYGTRSVGFLRTEIDTLQAAWANGATHDEVKALVKQLHADRLKPGASAAAETAGTPE